MTLVFLPGARAEAAELREAGSDAVARTGYAATADLQREQGLGPGETEDAEYAALTYAGGAALVANEEPLRLVLAAEVVPERVSPGVHRGLGQVQVQGLRWGEVIAVFLDDVAAREAVAQARAAVRGLDVAEALDSDPVHALLDTADLLWYDPAELDRLP